MSKRIRIVAISYSVDVTIRQFINIEKRDEKNLTEGKSLLAILEDMGASHVEYNGHFGPSIFFTLETYPDGKLDGTSLINIEKAIIDYANGK